MFLRLREMGLWPPEQHAPETGYVKRISIRLRIDRRGPTRDSRTMGRDIRWTMGKTVTGGFALVLLAGGLSVATAQPQGRGQRSTPQEVQSTDPVR